MTMPDGVDHDLTEPATPGDSPLRMRDALESQVCRDLSTAKLDVGDHAFEFALRRLGGGETVRLSAHAEQQPVALVFGSYT
jgi:hypothetical protein